MASASSPRSPLEGSTSDQQCFKLTNKEGSFNYGFSEITSSSPIAILKKDSSVLDDQSNTIEGFLYVRIHVRRRRYCFLKGRTLQVFNSQLEAQGETSERKNLARKTITVVGVKDPMEMDKTLRTRLLGSNPTAQENGLVIKTQKSKLFVVEAETLTEKQRWLHAMSCLNLSSVDSERSLFQKILNESTFDAHTAVTMLHKYRDNILATEMIVDHLAHYAESHIDDVEFYIQQIMHLIVNMDSAKTDKLVNLLLSICKAKVYVEHLGNSIHLALQLFWLLEAKIQDKDPNTYNLCAKLLMSIEAKIVNQHFEPAVGCVSQLLMDMPGLKQRVLALESPRKRKENQSSMSSPTRSASLNFPPPSPSPASVSSSSETRNVYVSEGKEYGPAVIRRYGNQNHKGLSIETDMKAADAADPASYLPSDVGEVDQNDGDDEEEELPPAKQRQILLQWMEKERQKRYKYFHQQRDFVNALTDISEKMRLIEPPSARKNHLPAALEALKIPEMAYIPLGRVSDPFCRITRVLKDEGTVFSTHSRAPCLLCFEVIEDQSNAAGKRTNSPSVAKRPVSPRRLSRSSCAGSSSTLITDETEIANYISKLSINGTYLSIEKDGKEDEEEDDQDDEIVDMAELERHLSEETKTSLDEATSSLNKSNVAISPSRHGDPTQTVSRSSSGSISSEISLGSSPISTTIPASGTTGDSTTGNLRRRSKNTYELGLSKLMAESGVFGESWKEKKERIRKASPYGALCGWNVISLISKSNDDIRQEVFAMQLITKFQDIFATNGLPLWLRPYRIISTGKSSGLIETITDAQSLDGLKKTADYQSLRVHFERTYGPDVHAKPFKTAQRNFLNSLVAYSLVCYLLQIKDRHNGNILIDSDGHLVHIDFGFMLGIAPGGQWSFETAPFKLTKEMVQVLGGVGCPLFGEFVQLFSLGMLVAQRNADKIITLVEIMMRNSTFPCFQGRDVSKELQKLKERFHLNLNKEQLVKHVIKMISTSYKNKWTKRYDQFQKLTNGIIP